MRDMVPKNNRSIRDIPVPHHRQPHDTEDLPMIERPVIKRPSPHKKRQRWFLISAIVVVVVSAIGGLLLSTLFSGATITVFPRQETVAAPKTLIASANPKAGEVGFQMVSVSQAASTTVPANGTKQVSKSASGVVTVYNAFGTESQRLIANTRFAAPDGKIYRIRDSIVVPGGIKAANGALTPGTLSVTIYADSPGAAYNKGDTRYTIPGFKDDPRYDKFYAQGASMTGGFVGAEPAVATPDLTKAGDLLKQSLSESAQASLTAQLPTGFLIVPGSLEMSFGTLTQTPGSSNSAVISQTGSLSGAIMRATDLAAAIAAETVANYKGEPVAVADLAAITVAAATTTNTDNSVTLVLSGTPTLVWQFDSEALKTALLGKKKALFQSVVDSFAPAFTRAEAKVRPFWKSSFPDNPNKIEIKVGAQ